MDTVTPPIHLICIDKWMHIQQHEYWLVMPLYCDTYYWVLLSKANWSVKFVFFYIEWCISIIRCLRWYLYIYNILTTISLIGCVDGFNLKWQYQCASMDIIYCFTYDNITGGLMWKASGKGHYWCYTKHLISTLQIDTINHRVIGQHIMFLYKLYCVSRLSISWWYMQVGILLYASRNIGYIYIKLYIYIYINIYIYI